MIRTPVTAVISTNVWQAQLEFRMVRTNQRTRKFRNETSNKEVAWIARKKWKCNIQMHLREIEEDCILSKTMTTKTMIMIMMIIIMIMVIMMMMMIIIIIIIIIHLLTQQS